MPCKSKERRAAGQCTHVGHQTGLPCADDSAREAEKEKHAQDQWLVKQIRLLVKDINLLKNNKELVEKMDDYLKDFARLRRSNNEYKDVRTN